MRIRPGWLALLALIGALPLALPGSSQDGPGELAEGAFSFRALAGYGDSGYALPVASSALGRDWALDSGFAWQVAYGQSVLPVVVVLEHRMPGAFRGRIEVECPNAYHPTEKGAGRAGLISREVIVPPGVGRRLYFPLRCAPEAAPGQLVSARVRLFAAGMQTPLAETEVEAWQLEPAHLYSLLLEGPEGEISADTLNPGNRLDLRYPGQGAGPLPYGGFAATSFDHYLLSCERGLVTALPTAATDTAFVCADLRAVRGWPSEEQQALLALALAGGHLWLYGAGGLWLGLDLGHVPAEQDFGRRQAGRGELLYCSSELPAARDLMARYLEGELSEFVLWQGGSAGGRRLDPDSRLYLGRRARLNEVYLPSEDPTLPALPNQRAGYLNPVIAYRELCRHGALEPLDFPEFSLAAEGADATALLLAANRNLAGIDLKRGGRLPPLLSSLAQPVLSTPRLPLLAAGLLLFALAPLNATGRRRGSRPSAAGLLGSLALACGFAAGAWVIWRLSSPEQPPVGIELVDRGVGIEVEARRTLHLRSTRGRAAASLEAPARSILRRANGAPPGEWRWDMQSGTGPGTLLLHGGEYASACFSGWSPPDPGQSEGVAGPEATLRRIDERRWELLLDPARIPGGRGCWLQSAYGLRHIPPGSGPARFELTWPPFPALPGWDRLAALRSFLSAAPGQSGYLETLVSSPGEAVQRLLAERPQDCGAATPLERLVLGAALQQPGGPRGLVFQAPLVYYFDRPTAGGRRCRLVRLTLDAGEPR